jgi:hypothetical protein
MLRTHTHTYTRIYTPHQVQLHSQSPPGSHQDSWSNPRLPTQRQLQARVSHFQGLPPDMRLAKQRVSTPGMLILHILVHPHIYMNTYIHAPRQTKGEYSRHAHILHIFVHPHTYIHTHGHAPRKTEGEYFKLTHILHIFVHPHTYIHTYIDIDIDIDMRLAQQTVSTLSTLICYIYPCIDIHTYIHTYIHT